MKIAMINITGGGMSGGYRKYLRNVIPRMAAHRNVDAILCVSPKSLNVQEWFEPIANVKFTDSKPFRFLRHNPDLQLRGYLKKFRPDVIFIPLERYVRFEETPVVNMVRNMLPLVTINKNPINERIRNWVQKNVARIAVKKSNRVIAVSEYVREYISNEWSIPNDRIGLVYHGITFPEEQRVERPKIISEVWRKQFLFTAGSIEPYRGLEDILSAIEFLSKRGIDTKVVIAGDTRTSMLNYQKRLISWAKKHNISSMVCWAGHLNEKEMMWCYQNCFAFVMTSRVESFGQIALEAMSNGCICVAADNPCFPEILGDAAIFYPPKDGMALAEAIQTVLGWDDNQRREASERAKKQASKFSWDVCAERTVTQLAKVVRR